MLLIYEDKKKRIIKNQKVINFSSSSTYHLIILTARAKGEKQISSSSTDDEELTLQIDDKTFPKLDSKGLVDSPAAINGGRLHNFSKTVYFLTYLSGKDHKLFLNTDNPPGTATFESLEIYILDPTDKLTLKPKIQAEDGDRRAWLAFVLDSISLKDVNITVTYSRRKRDSDDVKVKIDGQTQDNLFRNIEHFLWYFAGSLLPLIAPTKTESQSFTTGFSSGLHYIEIDADRMPILEEISFNFGAKLSPPKRIPTVDHPDVILAKSQYEPFNNSKSKIFKRITNPALDNLIEKQAWQDSYKAAESVFLDKEADPTNGANHFYVPSEQSKPDWVDENKFTVQIGATRFYKL